MIPSESTLRGLASVISLGQLAVPDDTEVLAAAKLIIDAVDGRNPFHTI